MDTYSDQSVLPSICLPEITFLGQIVPLAQSGSYFINISRAPLGKGCAVTLNQVSKFKVKVIAELCEKHVQIIHSLPLVQYCSYIVLYVQSAFSQRSRSYLTSQFFFRAYLFSHVAYLAHTLHKKILRFWTKFQGQM